MRLRYRVHRKLIAKPFEHYLKLIVLAAATPFFDGMIFFGPGFELERFLVYATGATIITVTHLNWLRRRREQRTSLERQGGLVHPSGPS